MTPTSVCLRTEQHKNSLRLQVQDRARYRFDAPSILSRCPNNPKAETNTGADISSTGNEQLFAKIQRDIREGSKGISQKISMQTLQSGHCNWRDQRSFEKVEVWRASYRQLTMTATQQPQRNPSAVLNRTKLREMHTGKHFPASIQASAAAAPSLSPRGVVCPDHLRATGKIPHLRETKAVIDWGYPGDREAPDQTPYDKFPDTPNTVSRRRSHPGTSSPGIFRVRVEPTMSKRIGCLVLVSSAAASSSTRNTSGLPTKETFHSPQKILQTAKPLAGPMPQQRFMQQCHPAPETKARDNVHRGASLSRIAFALSFQKRRGFAAQGDSSLGVLYGKLT